MEVNQAGPEAPNSKSLSLVGINSPSLLYLLSEDLETEVKQQAFCSSDTFIAYLKDRLIGMKQQSGCNCSAFS